MKANLLKEKKKEMENSTLMMDLTMKDNLKAIIYMVLNQKSINYKRKYFFSKIKKGKECIYDQIINGKKESDIKTKFMEKEKLLGLMVVSIMEILYFIFIYKIALIIKNAILN